MYLSRTAAPSITPVTLAEAKAQMRVTHSDHDTLITSLISAATDHFAGRNGILGRELISASWEFRCDAFPRKYPYALELPLPPLLSVASVKYVDDDSAVQTLTADVDYVVEIAEFVGRVLPPYNVTWPSSRIEANAVRIVFTAGYGPATTDIPEPIRQAILLKIETLYLREESDDMKRTIDNLISPFRLRKI